MAAAEPWASQFERQTGATSFDLRAAEYARVRPGYPRAATEAAVPPGATTVLDLAAGTGKLTEGLLAQGLHVIAVEPLPGMLAELSRLFPAAQPICGTAENIPLVDSSVDAVLVGQAFHWFDTGPALDEIARVLRPGGSLALLWNHDDESDPFVTEIYDALTAAGRPPGGTTRRGNRAEAGPDATARDAAIAPFTGHPAFTEPELMEVGWQRRQSVDDLIGLLNTYSYVIRSSDRARVDLEATVRLIARRHSSLDGGVQIPVICQVWRSVCR